MRRYAVYFAPPCASPLARFGDGFLGRDPWSGRALPQPRLEGVTPPRLRAVTAAPRRYGFHATLKPPFALEAGRSDTELHAALAALARRLAPVTAPPLALGSLGSFLALMPGAPSPALDELAASCVCELDHLRAPPSPAEIARRRRPDLSPQEEAYLEAWGYPYVLERFRFHMTLTCRLGEPEHALLRARLEPLAAPHGREPLVVDALCLFEQEGAGLPFRAAGRFPLGA